MALSFLAVWFSFLHLLDYSVHAAKTRQTILRFDSMPQLFGGQSGWKLSGWRAVDDRVRGGISQSYLMDSPLGARFYGNLDTQKLGGAGFASQLFVFPSVSDWSSSSNLVISFKTSSMKRISINLANSPSLFTSQIQYKVSIQPIESQDIQTFVIPFTDFVANYRGRDKPDAPPLNTKQITSISIMCQSYFQAQSGPFDYDFAEISLK